jgi:hypothetical protein
VAGREKRSKKQNNFKSTPPRKLSAGVQTVDLSEFDMVLTEFAHVSLAAEATTKTLANKSEVSVIETCKAQGELYAMPRAFSALSHETQTYDKVCWGLVLKCYELRTRQHIC